MLLAEAVVDVGEDAHHQVVGNELAVVDISLGGLAQLRATLDLVAQHVSGGDVAEAVFLNHLLALCALA